ncbi:hypothetical protein K435DRAFT_871700 [Dendrothele bispora CBS 962.96]|uniref:Uncharacterized protein n=1 Tax=Dendrothele bispora (strain CBS 962.96) TaxID=1314807 RepID=A0A4V4HCE4_DENBC|nr:hypothetical protein K435DRAFT_871700 [Dendrothele bispora CBS 962.96]
MAPAQFDPKAMVDFDSLWPGLFPDASTAISPSTNTSDFDIVPPSTPANPKPPPERMETVSPQQQRAYSHLIDPDSGSTLPPSKSTPSRDSPLTSPGSDSDSSSSSDNSSVVPVKMSIKAGDSWTNNGPGKAPTVHSRFLKPEEYGSIKASFLRYLRKAKCSDSNSEDARDHFMACFQNEQTMMFFAAARDDLVKLSPQKFEEAMLEHLIGTTWVKTVRALIPDARQDLFKDGAFSIMYKTLLSYNNLLKGVGKEIDASLFQSTLRAALNRDFETFLDSEEKDSHFRRFRRPELARLARLEELEKKHVSDSGNRCSNTSQSTPLHNISSTTSLFTHPTSASSSNNNSNRFLRLSELDSSQCILYNHLEMCFKCRTLFAGHRVNACTLPTPLLEVPFCPLDDADAVYAEKFHDKYKRPITYNAIIKRVRSAPSIAAVAPAPVPVAVDDLDAYMSKESKLSNIAAVWGDLPVCSMQSDLDLYSNQSCLRSPVSIIGCRCHSNSSELDNYHCGPSPVLHSPQRRHTSGSSSSSRHAAPGAAVIEEFDDRKDSDEDVDYRDENSPMTPP